MMDYRTTREPKSTRQLCLGEYIVESSGDTLLRVVGKNRNGQPELRRLEGPHAGSEVVATARYGRYWLVIPQDEAEERLIAGVLAMSQQTWANPRPTPSQHQ
jgi:hypothetical protein